MICDVLSAAVIPLTRSLSRTCIIQGEEGVIPVIRCQFLPTPFMHMIKNSTEVHAGQLVHCPVFAGARWHDDTFTKVDVVLCARMTLAFEMEHAIALCNNVIRLIKLGFCKP